MKFIIDIIPIILFFIAFKFYDIYIATAVAMVSSIVQIFWYRLISGKFESMHLITLVIITVLGGLTLFLQDENFIKWKPTIVNWAFALGLLIGTWVLKRPAIHALLGGKIELPAVAWKRLNWSWFIFFIISGSINLYVAFNFSTDTWVNFKLFGMLGLTLLFIIAQSIYIGRYLQSQQ